MKKILLVLLTIAGCQTVSPRDDSRVWSKSGRYALEMENDCNTSKHSIGLSGCAFFDKEIHGTLVLPKSWAGNISFLSSNCISFYYPALESKQNELSISEMYKAITKNSCEFEIVRTVENASNPIIGKFFIKILPSNQYISKLKYSIGDKSFDGVGWGQKLYSKQDPVLRIKTSGSSGQLIVMCGERQVSKTSYSSNEFDLKISSDESCNYELFAINDDSKYIELGTYMYQVVKDITLDVSIPIVLIYSDFITFSFKDKDSTGKHFAVNKIIITDIDNNELARCTSNECKVKNNKQSYFVKGYTQSLRFFYAEYKAKEKTWVVED